MPVDAPSDEHLERAPDWQVCRHVNEGERCIKECGAKYLPRLAGQNDAEYLAYVERAQFYNAFGRTVDGLSGMVFAKPPQITVPGAMEPLLEDVDLLSRSVQEFAEEVVEELLSVGRCGILVDHVSRPEIASDDDSTGGNAQRRLLTVREAESLNLRPYLALYKTEDILEVRLARIFGITRLVQVRLAERAERVDPDDEFTHVHFDRWRVLDLNIIDGRLVYEQRVFELDPKTNKPELMGSARPIMNGKPLDYIPFVPLGVRGISARISKPPLLDLATTNLSHWRTSADLENASHVTGIPTPVITGHQRKSGDEQYQFGTRVAWNLEEPDAKAMFLSYGGEGLGALEKRNASKEEQMAYLGARMLAPDTRGVEAAETAEIHRQGEVSVLASLANATSIGLTKAAETMRDWSGIGGDVQIKLNTDFKPGVLTPEMLDQLRTSMASGAITPAMWFDALKRGEIIGVQWTEEELEQQMSEPLTDPETIARILGNLGSGGIIMPENVNTAKLTTALRLPPGILQEAAPPPLMTEDDLESEELQEPQETAGAAGGPAPEDEEGEEERAASAA